MTQEKIMKVLGISHFNIENKTGYEVFTFLYYQKIQAFHFLSYNGDRGVFAI